LVPDSENDGPPKDINSEDLACLYHEGGAPLFNYLIKFAHSPIDDSPEHKPDISKVREWQYKDIAKIKDPDICREFKHTCQDELEALWYRGMFEKVERSSITKQLIKCQWVFDVKPDGCKKAQLVTKGFTQCEGTDYTDIYSPVVCFKTVRLMLGLAALEKWHITGLDVRNAYLYGKLDEEIYMGQCKGTPNMQLWSPY